MRRSVQLVAAVLLLVGLAAVPALAAACAWGCADGHPAAASAVATCHETSGDSRRLEGAGADPCATHDLASAEPAIRALVREQATLATAFAAAAGLSGPIETGRRASAVTPGTPRPGPSRPPLVLRV